MRAGAVRQGVLLAIVIACVLAVDFPLLWMPLSSVKPFRELFASPPLIVPREVTFRHYADLFARTNFPTYFMNSAIVCVGTVVVALALSVPAAYALTRYRFRGREVFAQACLVIYMFPPIFLAIPLFVLLVKVGLSNTYAGLILTHTTFALPFSIWLLRTFFRAIALELEEAAWVDGAGRWRAFWHVVWPLALTGIIATGIFTAILSWNEYLFALILMPGEAMKTLPVGVSLFMEASSVEWGLIMAAAVLVSVPAVGVFVLMHRYVIQGMSVGALKE
jgi:multiple sugar transport system permease protein